MHEIGERVGAIRDMDGKGNVNFFGYGVYEGDKPCPWLDNMDNPVIKLDTGKTVWGCECWWGPEDEIKKKLEGLTITMVEPES